MAEDSDRRHPETEGDERGRRRVVTTATSRKHRILIAKPGLDGHDRGAKVVAASLRDAGFEVIYLGLQQTPEMIAAAAAQEDAEAVGLSVLSGAHLTLFPRVQQCLKDQGLGDVLLFGGGIVPPEDARALRRKGIGKIFGPGTDTREISAYLFDRLSGKGTTGKGTTKTRRAADTTAKKAKTARKPRAAAPAPRKRAPAVRARGKGARPKTVSRRKPRGGAGRRR